MAATAVYPAMNGDKGLFPLFTKGSEAIERNAPLPTEDIQPIGLDGAQDEEGKPKKASKPRKQRKKQVPGQKTLQEIVNPQASSSNDDARIAKEDEPSKEGPSPRRSKRRRTSRENSVEVGGQNEEYADNVSPQQRRSSPQVVIPASSPLPTKPVPATEADQTRTPKKMLRLKAGGKFSSPVSKKPTEVEPPVEQPKRRGRPRKPKEAEKDKSLVAIVRYGAGMDLGARIDRILDGEEVYKKQVKIVPKSGTPRKGTDSAHPFFSLDRRKEQAPPPPPTEPSPRKASAVGPGKLRRETMGLDRVERAPEVTEVWTSTLLKDRLMFRHPGAMEPAWPNSEQTHVRGLTSPETEALTANDYSRSTLQRKRKAAQKPVSRSESLVPLVSEEDGQLRPDGFREPHPSLHLPKRQLIPGGEIVARVAKQISVPLADPDADEIVYENSTQQQIHQALPGVYNKIPTALSAFDEIRGEPLPWTGKYAPASCAEVLQPARETKVLKDWLSSLTVTAVDNALKTNAPSKAEPKPKKRKRRRKDDDLDDFIVGSDEIVHDMDELTDPEDAPIGKAVKSIVQVAADGVKLSNAVLLSGPHGCGKTAAAYAVAKELGFRVFEISSSERRSGKDVLDKVGNMTENHLVKHHGTEGEQSFTEEPDRLDEAFQRDLASGRQGKMAAFFKPQAKAKPTPKPTTSSPKKVAKTKALDTIKQLAKKPPKDQAQSLILLEEVDILFKEDREFWSTVLKLIATSKRPFIMTCNDEDLVPLQAMSLHAILRFSPPPLELATDYLLLIAAAEGHLLQRDAVASQYQSKGSDLRAAITELDLWCQMGVGDPRAGLSWLYQRYPPGSDLDERGRKLRVVSEGTYQTSMGRPQDALHDLDKLQWQWHQHRTETSQISGWDELDEEDTDDISLSTFTKFANDLSAADVYGRTVKALDISQKPMRDQARTQYIEGLPLLQTDEELDYTGTSQQLQSTATLFAFKARGLLTSGQLRCNLSKPPSRSEPSTEPLNRAAFTVFDPISVPTDSALSTSTGFQQSILDGPLAPIATDIAPYVRSIAHFDLALAEQREAMGGGKGSKRARTTRAARSALEGGQRASTRREKWFPKELDLENVLRTGGSGWPRMMPVGGGDASGEGEEVPASSAESNGEV